MITYLKGDATQPQGEGTKIIVHVCNDIDKWGAGFVMALSKKWPETKKAYHLNAKILGTVGFVQVEPDIIVANMIAQGGVRSFDNPVPLDYFALQECLEIVNIIASRTVASVHMPRIGCGLAGGSWKEVEWVVTRHLPSDVPVYVYDLE